MLKRFIPNNTQVSFNNDSVQGRGVVVGLATIHNTLGYIIKIDEMSYISNSDLEVRRDYDCFVVAEEFVKEV